jgi:REP element-mobilizing transposase RayT
MYRRNLPHWYPYDAAVFVTWRLFGTLPRRPGAARPEVVNRHAFREADRQLDLAAIGPTWLLDAAVAERVAGTIEAAAAERGLCTLHAYVVMPNHVHLLLSPNKPLCEVTKWIKGASARHANLLLGRTGQPFWQDESFDHWARNRAEFEKIRYYIEHNPVSAGLVAEPAQWPYSSARRRAQAEGGC